MSCAEGELVAAAFTCFDHIDMNGFAHFGAIGLMCAVAELKRQRVFAGRKFQFGFSLSFAEMKVLVIERHRLSFGDRIIVND